MYIDKALPIAILFNNQTKALEFCLLYINQESNTLDYLKYLSPDNRHPLINEISTLPKISMISKFSHTGVEKPNAVIISKSYYEKCITLTQCYT